MDLNNEEKSLVRQTAQTVLRAAIDRTVWSLSPGKAAVLAALIFGVLMYLSRS